MNNYFSRIANFDFGNTQTLSKNTICNFLNMNTIKGGVLCVANSRNVSTTAYQMFLFCWYEATESVLMEINSNMQLVLKSGNNLTGQSTAYFGFNYTIGLTCFPLIEYF